MNAARLSAHCFARHGVKLLACALLAAACALYAKYAPETFPLLSPDFPRALCLAFSGGAAVYLSLFERPYWAALGVRTGRGGAAACAFLAAGCALFACAANPFTRSSVVDDLGALVCVAGGCALAASALGRWWRAALGTLIGAALLALALSFGLMSETAGQAIYRAATAVGAAFGRVGAFLFPEDGATSLRLLAVGIAAGALSARIPPRPFPSGRRTA